MKKSLKRAKLAAHIATRFSAGSWRLSFNEFTVPHSTKERFQEDPLRIADLNNKIMPVREAPVEEKRRLLKKAVEAQDFETAAVLRDEIKEMEQNG